MQDFTSLFTLILCVAGIIGNILSVCVLVRKELAKSVSSQELLALTFFDTLLLLTFTGEHFIYNFNMFEEGNRIFILIADYIIFPINQVAYTGSVYTTILISRDRYLAICSPLQSIHMLTLKKTRISILLILVFSVLINLPVWFQPFLEKLDLSYYSLIYNNIKWFALTCTIPFVCIGWFNYRICMQVKEMRRIREGMSGQNPNSTNEDASLSRMLFIVVAVFIILNTLSFLIRISVDGTMNFSLPIVINSSINILIYAGFGKVFRCEFLKMIKSWIGVLNCCAYCGKHPVTRGGSHNRTTVLETDSTL